MEGQVHLGLNPLDDEAQEPEDLNEAIAAADQAKAELKKAFDTYFLYLLKRQTKG